MAMPWSRAKAIAADYRSGARDVKKLTALFDACFRIQREAIEAAGHFIPLVVENVRGACPWVGRSRWNFGSFHLWGDVPALMPMAKGRKNDGGSWFNIGSPGQKETNRNPVRYREAIKNGGDWFGSGDNCSLQRKASSKSDSRKAASAAIAKIPFPLSQHIARAWKPELSAA